MRTYELTYILPDKISEKEIPQVCQKIKKLIPLGKILKENFLGRRKLAYPIKKNDFGYYATLVFETEPEILSKMAVKLRLEEDVIRYLLVGIEKAKEVKKVKERKEIKKVEKPKIKVKAKPKKAKITVAIEKEEEKMKALEEKLEEILKE